MQQDRECNLGRQGHRRDVVWQTIEEPGIEHLVLGKTLSGAFIATSAVVGLFNGQPSSITYNITMNPNWHTTRVVVTVNNIVRRLDLLSDGSGNWTSGDPDLDQVLEGCLDVDIIVTPFTNTLPIRRLDLSVGNTAEIEVVYIMLPSLDISRKRQRYTRKSERRWCFDSLEDDCTVFSADLEVDADGLVTDYPGLFTRLYPASPER